MLEVPLRRMNKPEVTHRGHQDLLSKYRAGAFVLELFLDNEMRTAFFDSVEPEVVVPSTLLACALGKAMSDN